MGTETRLKVLGLAFAAFALILLGRLFFWQVIKSDELASEGRAQHVRGSTVHAARGTILASDGSWLAANVDNWLMYAVPVELTAEPRALANTLSPFTAVSQERQDLLTEAMRLEGVLARDGAWLPLTARLSTEIKENIDALGLDGIGFDLEEARYYPEASSAAQVLGFVGKDESGSPKGYFGLEGYYDLTLAGKPGFWQRESNAVGIPLLFGNAQEIAAVKGVDLVTHIDKAVQLSVEKHLKEGLERYGAVSGNVIVIDPQDGGILAMAAFPSYDPAKYYEFGDALFKNPTISDAFEPGSVFKPIIMASGLDAEVVEPDTKCDICNEPLKVDKYFIKTWDNKYHENSTMTEVIMHSDNVGMAFVGGRLGADRMYAYLTKFGFGEPTGIDLQGEADPPIREKGKWGFVDVATASFGQGIAVTPIQLITAVTTIARDGVPMKPQVVDKLRVEGWEEDIEPEEGKRVVSEEAANEITEMMVKAASQGEAKWAIPEGFKIAGKTGTAQIPVEGHYDADKTVASFVGFAPPEEPKFVMLVTLREPQSSPWASETAAPLWFAIAKDLFLYFGIQPQG